MKLEIRDCTVKEALAIVRRLHRHLPKKQGGMFACLVVQDGVIVGTAIAGNPAQVWQGTGRIEITRVAVEETARNASSKLYGAICRAAEALGYAEAWTYSLPEESGESLRGAGFEDMGVSDGGEHDRPSRPRAAAVRPDPKRRWRRKLGSNRLRERVVRTAKVRQGELFETVSYKCPEKDDDPGAVPRSSSEEPPRFELGMVVLQVSTPLNVGTEQHGSPRRNEL